MALELVKYQTIMVMLFTNHSPARCLEYDSLFRQAAVRDSTLHWDIINPLYPNDDYSRHGHSRVVSA